MQQIGFVGLGSMGLPMAQRLAAAGYPVRAWNRTPERGQPLLAQGVELVASPGQTAAGADLVFICVADDAALQAVTDEPDGLLASCRPGQVWVILSTVSPAAIRQVASLAALQGVEVLDVGVLGNRMHSARGELRLYVGGSPATLARLSPVLGHLGQEIVSLGGLGTGMAMKLALNLLMGLEMQALAEAVVFATASGIERQQAIRCLTQSGFSSPVMNFKAQRMAQRRYGDPDFRLSLMAKDLGLLTAAARELGVPTPATNSAHAAHATGLDLGFGDQDCAAIVRVIEEAAHSGNPYLSHSFASEEQP